MSQFTISDLCTAVRIRFEVGLMEARFIVHAANLADLSNTLAGFEPDARYALAILEGTTILKAIGLKWSSWVAEVTSAAATSTVADHKHNNVLALERRALSGNPTMHRVSDFSLALQSRFNISATVATEILYKAKFNEKPQVVKIAHILPNHTDYAVVKEGVRLVLALGEDWNAWASAEKHAYASRTKAAADLAARDWIEREALAQFKPRRPTAQEVYERILACQGDEGIKKMLRAFNVVELIIDYGELTGFPPGPEACQCWEMMQKNHGPDKLG